MIEKVVSALFGVLVGLLVNRYFSTIISRIEMWFHYHIYIPTRRLVRIYHYYIENRHRILLDIDKSYDNFNLDRFESYVFDIDIQNRKIEWKKIKEEFKHQIPFGRFV